MTLVLATALAVGAFSPDALIAGNPYVLRGHSGTVVAVALSPDGQVAASAARDGTVRVWGLATGATARVITGAEQQISALAFSADGALLAIGETALKVRVVAVSDGAARYELAHPDSVSDVAFSPDGTHLAVAGQGNNGAVFKLGVAKPVATFRGRSVRYSADGATLLAANGAGSLALIDAKTGKERRAFKTEPYLPYATWAGDLIATWNGVEHDVRTWSAATLKAGPVLKGVASEPGALSRPRVLAVALDADGKHLLALYGDGRARLWNTAKQVAVTSWPTEQAAAVALSGGWVAIADGSVVKLWKREKTKD
jgi:WD40 repeat protein